jgi:MFS family permease
MGAENGKKICCPHFSVSHQASHLSTTLLMNHSSPKWYSSVTRYQWLVLIVASLGWVFDAFEGQIYNLTRADMLPDLLEVKADDPLVKVWGERFLGIFLLGGTFGGLLFSSLADKWGRNPVMALTILFYSVFSGITAFADEIWQVGVLRFLVAMGVGGEWAVGAALVAEVFPKEARERAGGIFHATSVCGLWLAAAAGLWVGSEWRTAYLLGVAPALLVLWVRMSIKEPESWKAAHGQFQRIARRCPLALASGVWRFAGDGGPGDLLGRGGGRAGHRRRFPEAHE